MCVVDGELRNERDVGQCLLLFVEQREADARAQARVVWFCGLSVPTCAHRRKAAVFLIHVPTIPRNVSFLAFIALLNADETDGRTERPWWSVVCCEARDVGCGSESTHGSSAAWVRPETAGGREQASRPKRSANSQSLSVCMGFRLVTSRPIRTHLSERPRLAFLLLDQPKIQSQPQTFWPQLRTHALLHGSAV